jgi:hypothetical protein
LRTEGEDSSVGATANRCVFGAEESKRIMIALHLCFFDNSQQLNDHIKRTNVQIFNFGLVSRPDNQQNSQPFEPLWHNTVGYLAKRSCCLILRNSRDMSATSNNDKLSRAKFPWECVILCGCFSFVLFPSFCIAEVTLPHCSLFLKERKVKRSSWKTLPRFNEYRPIISEYSSIGCIHRNDSVFLVLWQSSLAPFGVYFILLG